MAGEQRGWGDKGESNLWGKTKKEEEEERERERGRRAAQLGGRLEWVLPSLLTCLVHDFREGLFDVSGAVGTVKT